MVTSPRLMINIPGSSEQPNTAKIQNVNLSSNSKLNELSPVNNSIATVTPHVTLSELFPAVKGGVSPAPPAISAGTLPGTNADQKATQLSQSTTGKVTLLSESHSKIQPQCNGNLENSNCLVSNSRQGDPMNPVLSLRINPGTATCTYTHHGVDKANLGAPDLYRAPLLEEHTQPRLAAHSQATGYHSHKEKHKHSSPDLAVESLAGHSEQLHHLAGHRPPAIGSGITDQLDTPQNHMAHAPHGHNSHQPSHATDPEVPGGFEVPRPTCGYGPIDLSVFTPQLDPTTVSEYSQRIENCWPHTTSQAHERFPEFCKTYQKIKSFNLPNALGAKITLPSGLNLRSWEHHLKAYHDKEICAYLRFGWPVGYAGNKPPVSVPHNHPSGNQFKSHVRDFISTELAHDALVGPFPDDPFTPWMRKSPIMSRPKKDSLKRRIIIDLTFPGDDGVNSGIDIHWILGKDTSYSLPNIWDLTQHLKVIGPGAWIWKADLQRAYRQLRVDVIDAPLLGLQVDADIFVDLCPSFGCRSSSAACQRTANAITYLMRSAGYIVYAYLDDFAGCALDKDQADKAYVTFKALLAELGLQLAHDKCQEPVQDITWLGYQVSTRDMVLSVPKDKLLDLQNECSQWLNKHRVTKKALQSLLGKILHVAPCIRHARKFTARLLAAFRNMKTRNWTTLTDDCKADIKWFKEYAARANGVTIYADHKQYLEFECDACLSGAGGNSDTHCYTWEFTQQHQQNFPHIHQLEAVNILVALRTLAPHADLNNKGIIINTDNISYSFAISTGKTRDPVLAACAREIWLEAAIRDIDIRIQHKPGHLIPLPDALSRASVDHQKRDFACAEIQKRGLIRLSPSLNGYCFFDSNL